MMMKNSTGILEQLPYRKITKQPKQNFWFDEKT
jgi:hypothetical protein